MFCGPEYTDLLNPHSHFKGYNSIFRRCMYKKNAYELVIEYFEGISIDSPAAL